MGGVDGSTQTRIAIRLGLVPQSTIPRYLVVCRPEFAAQILEAIANAERKASE